MFIFHIFIGLSCQNSHKNLGYWQKIMSTTTTTTNHPPHISFIWLKSDTLSQNQILKCSSSHLMATNNHNIFWTYKTMFFFPQKSLLNNSPACNSSTFLIKTFVLLWRTLQSFMYFIWWNITSKFFIKSTYCTCHTYPFYVNVYKPKSVLHKTELQNYHNSLFIFSLSN